MKWVIMFCLSPLAWGLDYSPDGPPQVKFLQGLASQGLTWLYMSSILPDMFLSIVPLYRGTTQRQLTTR